MALPYLGHGASLGIGFETTWGTEVARTNWMRVVSLGVERQIDKPRRAHLGTLSAASYVSRSHFIASDNVAGSIEVLASYDDSTVALVAHAFGAAADAGAGPYTHTITPAEPGLTGLTLETINGTGLGEQWEGCKINRAELSVEAGQEMRLRLDVMAETNTGLEAAGSPSYPTEEPILHSHAGQFTHNSVAADLVSFSLVRDRKLGTRQLLGSAKTKEPAPTDFSEVTGTLVFEYSATNNNSVYIADTQSDATITFTGSGNHVLAITLHNMLITKVMRGVGSVGVIRETVEFRCEATASEAGASLVFTNDNALYTTNG
jgi:hypothetical protein